MIAAVTSIFAATAPPFTDAGLTSTRRRAAPHGSFAAVRVRRLGVTITAVCLAVLCREAKVSLSNHRTGVTE